MSIRTGVRRWFRLDVLRRDLREAEVDEEIRQHLVLRAEHLVRHGWPERTAFDEALRRFGPRKESRDRLLIAAHHREARMRTIERFDAIWHDFSYSLRQLRRSPALGVAVAATFALGIGAHATMFGIVDRLLLRAPAHIAAPHEMGRIDRVLQRRGQLLPQPHSYPAYVDLRDNLPAFSSVAMYSRPRQVSLGLGPDARGIRHLLVSGNYFQTLGTRMALGRPILPEDDVLPTGTNVVVIGYGLWQSEFGADPGVVGRSITLAGRPFTVVGVTPQNFVGVGSEPVDVWMPVSAASGLHFASEWATTRSAAWLNVVGRLRPGHSVATASAQATAALRAGNSADRGRADTTTRAAVHSILPEGQSAITAEKRVAILLAGVSLLVLLIASANVANLLLSRALSRRREIAVRLALGISRARLVRQLMTETVVLALIGGAAGVAVVYWGSGVIQRVLLSDYAWPASPVDGRVLAFMLLVTLSCALLSGLIPALQASAPDMSGALKEQSHQAGQSRAATRAALLITQGAFSLVLVVGTGLFVRSLDHVDDVDLGLDADRLIVGSIDLRSVGIDSSAVDSYYQDAVARAALVTGIAGVTFASAPPMGDWTIRGQLSVPGRDSAPDLERGPLFHSVAPGYFSVVGTRLLRGRDFVDSDAAPGAEPVVILNEHSAARLWPGVDALGKCVSLNDGPCARVIAIVANTHINSAREAAIPAQVYVPFGTPHSEPRAYYLIARREVTGNAAELIEPLRHAMQSVRPQLPHAEVEPMLARLDNELRPWRMGATIFGAFGAVALLLSALGLYAVVAYTVAQRTHELGVRIALGARAGQITFLVLTQGMRTALAGVILGTGIVLLTGRFIEPMLFQVSARDPLVIGSAVLVLLGASLLANLIPAHRATRANPMTALQAD